MKIRLKVTQPNPEKFIDEVIDRYHFGINSRRELTEIYYKIMETAEPYAEYRINQRVTGIRLIDDNQAAIVSMTLGIGLDDLKDSYTKKSELDKAYMLDCITNELLMKMYVEFNNMYARYHRRYVKRYVFIGDEISTNKIPELLNEIKEKDCIAQEKRSDEDKKIEMTAFNEEIGSLDLDKQEKDIHNKEISANEYGVLSPAKSVVFYAILTENPNKICEGICENCNNKACENNPLYEEEENE
ncbi:MAG: hypothetical protein IJ141_02805 [Lachnospiraceae bacterium]|nr:hypothetical protein [Lachnospiraceae bacterium]